MPMKRIALLLFCCLLPLFFFAQEPDSIQEPEKNASEFWSIVFQQYDMPEYYQRKGYNRRLRGVMNKRCASYLREIDQIAYGDAYVLDYVQGIFARVAPTKLNPNLPLNLNIRVFQFPEPDVFMLPNGTLLISTGMLCTLDSEEELEAILANELGHYVLDHSIYNVHRAEQRARRAAAWGVALSVVGFVADAVSVATVDNSYHHKSHLNDFAAFVSLGATIGSVASIATADAAINSQRMNHLGLTYKRDQERDADQIVKRYLTYNNMNPNALTSALSKIRRFYAIAGKTDDLPRFESCKALQKRIKVLGENDEEVPQNHFYRKSVSDVVTFNATMYLNDGQYKQAEKLVQKNIDEHLASAHDYVIFVKARMAQENTPESNEACMLLLEKARKISPSTNLDINKQEIVLLLRMKKQARAADALQHYLEMLRDYAQQDKLVDDERRWIEEETGWADKTLDQIHLL